MYIKNNKCIDIETGEKYHIDFLEIEKSISEKYPMIPIEELGAREKVMKIDSVYIVRLFIVESRIFKFSEISYEVRFLKWTLVYNKDDDYIDLKTGKKYKIYGKIIVLVPAIS